MKSKATRFAAVPVRVNRLTAGVAMAISGLAPHAVAAQELGQNTTDELIVSATRRDTNIQDVPYSIAALSNEELRRLQIDDLSGIARYTPGLIQVDQGGRDASQLIIRGINSRAINSPELLANTTGDRVATFYGETPVYIDLKQIDLNRVEVLRGPQGTIFGARSLAGAVRYLPNLPNMSDFSIDARAIGSATDESSGLNHEGSLVVNMPLLTDTLALRALVGYANERGFIDYNFLVPEPGVSCPEPGFSDPACSSDGFNADKDANSLVTRSYGLALRWDMSETLSATLSWRQQNQDSGGRNASSRDALQFLAANRGIDIDTGPYVSGLRFSEPNSRINNIANLTVDWDTGFGMLRSTTSYTTFDEKGQRDQTDLLLDLEPDDYYYYEEFPAFSAFTKDVRDDEIFTQEVRLVSYADSDSRVSWLAGAFYQDGDFFSRNQEFTPGYAAFDPVFTDANGDLEFDNKTFQTENELALFGELGFDVNDQLNITVGARWFDFDFDIRSCTAFPIASTAFGGSPDVDDPSNCSPNTGFQQVGDSDILGKLSATYLFNDNITSYFIFSQGYSPGGANARASDAEKLVGPESTDNYELGVKSSWLDNRLTVNGALFYIDWSDIQLPGQLSADENSRITRNGGTAESQGLELETVLRVNDSWTIAAGYAYTYAELTEGCNNGELDDPNKSCPLPNEPTASGDRLPGSPEHQGNLRIAYDRELTGDLAMQLVYGLTSQSDVLTRIGAGRDCCRDNGEALPGFTLHNASATLINADWEARLFIDNMFNKYAETGVREDRSKLATAGSFTDFTLRRYWKNVVRPRTVGVDLLYRFK